MLFSTGSEQFSNIIGGLIFYTLCVVLSFKIKKLILTVRFKKWWNLITVFLIYNIFWAVFSLTMYYLDIGYWYSIAIGVIYFSSSLFSLISIIVVFIIYKQLTMKYNEQSDYIDRISKASQFKSEFMSTMTHELKTPLNAIIGFSDLLIEGLYGTLSKEQFGFIKDINSSGEHLLDLIDKFLDISKIEAGKLELHIQPIDLKKMLNQIKTAQRDICTSKGLEIMIEGLENEEIIYADPGRLKEVFLTLTNTSIKITTEGVVSIQFINKNDMFEFHVSDSSAGLPERDQDRMFKEFEHMRDVSDYYKEDTGLELPLAKRIIELHGGTMKYTASATIGSEFVFSLPKSLKDKVRDETHPIEGQDQTIVPGSVIKLLLIEDGKHDAMLVKKRLDEIASLQFEFIWVKNLSNGIDYLKNQKLDLVLLDLNLPDSNGRDTVETVLNQKIEVPIVILTCKEDNVFAEETVKMGAQDYLNKNDLTAVTLEKAIRFAIERNIIMRNKNTTIDVQ